MSPKPAAEKDEHAIVNARMQKDEEGRRGCGATKETLLDDMCLSLKRRRNEDDPVGAEKLVQKVMSVVLHAESP